MLPREDRGRRHHHALPARLDRDQQRHERHQRLARAHIALQQTVHPGRRAMSAAISAMARAARPWAKRAAMSAPSARNLPSPRLAKSPCRRRECRASARVS
jgi:hypothetical protein